LYGGRGKKHLMGRLSGYNNAARHGPWLVLIDLDRDADCAPEIHHVWLESPARLMCFRIAVREVESWLLGDRERFAKLLSVTPKRISPTPESLNDPKEYVIGLARLSRKRAIREEMLPRPGSGRSVGPAYTSRLMQFVYDEIGGWRPGVAQHACPSLAKCLACLRGIISATDRGT
jgi:hypothetical protein